MTKSSIQHRKMSFSVNFFPAATDLLSPRLAFTPLGLYYPPRFAREAKATLGCKGQPRKKKVPAAGKKFPEKLILR